VPLLAVHSGCVSEPARPLDNLVTTLLDLYHLGFQTGDEVVEPAGHIHVVFTAALDFLVKGRSIVVVVFADGE
jgi:hypothetical protein